MGMRPLVPCIYCKESTNLYVPLPYLQDNGVSTVFNVYINNNVTCIFLLGRYYKL